MTFTEIISGLLRAEGVNNPTPKLRPDRERSWRRALKGLCDQNLISTLGSGRIGNPYRYTMKLSCAVCR